MNKYQAVIIGFGKAGKTLAVTLAKAGWRVALIEQSNAMYGGPVLISAASQPKHWFMTHSSTQILSEPYSVKMKWLIFYVIRIFIILQICPIST